MRVPVASSYSFFLKGYGLVVFQWVRRPNFVNE
jgi:hypothetical protein